MNVFICLRDQCDCTPNFILLENLKGSPEEYQLLNNIFVEAKKFSDEWNCPYLDYYFIPNNLLSDFKKFFTYIQNHTYYKDKWNFPEEIIELPNFREWYKLVFEVEWRGYGWD